MEQNETLSRQISLTAIAIVGKIFTKRCFHSPIFVVGTGRSGTSVLLQALGKHPLIFALPGEAPLITSYGGIAYQFESGKDRDYYAASLKVTKDRLYSSLRRLCFETSAGRDWGCRTLVKDAIKLRELPWKKRYWSAKTFPSVRVAEGLRALYPAGKFVYIIRNGIDVVHSMTKFAGFRDRDFEKQCKNWSDDMERYKYLLGCDFAIMVRHEELVGAPERVFQKIFSFVGIENSSTPASFVKTNLVHPLDKPTQNVAAVEKVLTERQPGYTSWTSEQKNSFKAICGQAMHESGYEVPF